MKKTFIALFFLILVLFPGLSLIRGELSESYVENRALYKYPSFDVGAFLSGTYQGELENALSDQVYGAEFFKIGLENSKNTLQTVLYEGLLKSKNSIYKDYQPIGSDFLKYLPTGHILENNSAFGRKVYSPNGFLNLINRLSKMEGDKKFYVYYIETDYDIDAPHFDSGHIFYKTMKSGLSPVIGIERFYLKNIGDYTKTFYKSDHHWKAIGQEIGYSDMARLMGVSTSDLLQTEVKKIPCLDFVGSRSRQIADLNLSDTFDVLTAELPRHKESINGIPKRYDNKGRYALMKSYNGPRTANHYANANGWDYGLVSYDYQRGNGKNLLVVGDSYINPVNSFLAYHFDKSYFIDPRHYEDNLKEPLDLEKFILENDIDTVLFVGRYKFFGDF